MTDHFGGRDDAVSDAEKWGIAFDPALVEGAHGDGIWAQNVAAVTAFLNATTQWRTVVLANGRPVVTGLDYAGVRAGLDGAGIVVSPDLWADLRVVEIGAMSEMNEAAR